MNIHAQVSLTIGDIYDYSVGDIFQYSYMDANTSPTYITDTVVVKNLSGNSVTYDFKRYSYKLPSCSSCSPTITYSTYSDTYSNLSSMFAYTNNSSCCTGTTACIHDTIKSNGFCGNVTYESVWTGPMDPNNLSTCSMYDKSFAKGLGITYDRQRSSNTNFDQEKKMIYYKKGNSACGNYTYVGINESQNKNKVSLFPNPTTGILNIELEENVKFNSDLFILNSLGEIIISLPYTSRLDVSELKSGFYILRIKVKTDTYNIRFFKIN